MANSVKQAMLVKQATRLNAQNKAIRDGLNEVFPDIPVFMNVLTEEEIPEDTMTYFVIETGNFNKMVENSNGVTENVAITLWARNREDPTLDQLLVIMTGNDAGLRFSSATNDYIINSDNSQIVGMFTARFTRAVKVGC